MSLGFDAISALPFATSGPDSDVSVAVTGNSLTITIGSVGIIADPNKTVDGFIAHEVSDIVPEAITKEKDAIQLWTEGEELPEGVSIGDNKLDADGNTIPDYQGIDQSKLVPLLVKTIQELEARITTLEANNP